MHNDSDTHIPDLPVPALLAGTKEVVMAELHRRLGQEGHPAIRAGHGCVFRFVAAEGSRVTTMAALAGMSKQAVGEVVDDLEALGYVERVPDPADRRAKLIRLTELGLEGQAAARRIFAEIERSWAERYGEERIATMREVLEQIIADAEVEAVIRAADDITAASAGS